MTDSYYAVRFVIVVDRPDLRGPTFPVVEAGHKIPTAFSFKTQKHAVMMFDSMVAGREDYGSEFIQSVEVVQVRPNSSPRVVRRRVVRNRKG